MRPWLSTRNRGWSLSRPASGTPPRDTPAPPRAHRTPSRPPHHPAAAVPPPTALPPSQAPGSPEAPTLTPAITASTLIDPTQPRSPAPTLPDPTSAATRITITPGDHSGDHFRHSSRHPTSDH
ncbi:hypothetical protein C0992_005501 [Termitomyces sp. T32_za158]|nr:hypothetical protein C0992_005501 [Termitomyces sp. T32_za158]